LKDNGKKKENIMLKLLLVSPDENSLSGLASALKEHKDVEICWADSGERALDIVSETAIDLVVIDENLGDMTNLEFAGRLLSLNPMINSVSVSSLSSKKFHEISEGLGLMDQLPIQPGQKDAEKLLQNLRHIKGLTGGM